MVVMLYLFGGAFACVGKCRSCGAHITFHFVCTQGFISGFALIPPWAMRGYRPFRAHCRIGRLGCCVVVLCSLNVFGCVNGLLRSCFCLIVIVWFVVLGGLIDAVG